MLIDCDTCAARGAACSTCLITVLEGEQPGGRTAEEQRAIEVFARAGFDVEVLEEPTPPRRLRSRSSRTRRRLTA